ncbi:MAG TPA: CBS domain-containing protein [Candidatus Bathyarchaeia archaeon]|nr:CBS domain-containing protein [Candidatus Bathyarchaeia archaeon]
MTVAAILKAKGSHVETTHPTTSLYTVAWQLKSKNIGALVVLDEDDARILGMISERDIVHALIEHEAHVLTLPVSRVMTTRMYTCTPGDRITAVMALMTRHRVRHLPVVDGGRLAGIVSIGDLVKHRIDELEMEANTLRETLMVGR